MLVDFNRDYRLFVRSIAFIYKGINIVPNLCIHNDKQKKAKKKAKEKTEQRKPPHKIHGEWEVRIVILHPQ